MKLQDQKSLQLTAKQRLAVSREALIKASRQNLWQGVTGLAAGLYRGGSHVTLTGHARAGMGHRS
jgi:hypothetical protein